MTLTGLLYVTGPSHLAWVLFITLPDALLQAALTRIFGIQQSRAVLEQVSRRLDRRRYAARCPRTSLPGSAPVGTPSRNVMRPEMIVAS